jgi:hypothetical protein
MDEIMNKVGAYWLGQRANKEISSAGDDLEVRETKLSHPLLFLAAHAWLNFCSFRPSVVQLKQVSHTALFLLIVPSDE